MKPAPSDSVPVTLPLRKGELEGVTDDACHLVGGLCHATGLPPGRCPMHSRVGRIDTLHASIERRVELRHSNQNRCRHRATEPHREEPCGCPSIVMLPIYRCELLNCECADLRQPRESSAFCASCTHRAPDSV